MSASVASHSSLASSMSCASGVDSALSLSTKYSPDTPSAASLVARWSAVEAPSSTVLARDLAHGTTSAISGRCHSGALPTMWRPSSVSTKPGHSAFTVTADPPSLSRRASSLAKRMFAAFEAPYAAHGLYPSGTCPSAPVSSSSHARCAADATTTTRAPPSLPEASSCGSSSLVSSKCPTWLMPIWNSSPSLVVHGGVAITPALFTSSATGPRGETLDAKARTDRRSARSRGSHVAEPPAEAPAAETRASAAAPLAGSRQPSTTS
mmetsp:Transcript_22339/g.75857  ORF Transcript_22339/g.75857 Transcript_22339/m.75857 type:complete len:265 (+) Transcript_22339:185-979(+)